MSALAGKHAIVTGASRGIGAAIARSLSASGASVTLMVRDRAGAATLASELRVPNGVVVADVTDDAAVHSACAEAAARIGPVDILINNAGVADSAPFLKSEPALFERLFAVHVLGAVHTMQAVLPSMLERGRGHIVNVASIAGLRGAPYVTAYSAAKHALVGLTKSLALEVGPRGVAVGMVCPGYADTDMVRAAIARVVARTGMGVAEALQGIMASAGQSRLITSDEVASAVVALCRAPASPDAQVVVLDGSADE